MDATRSQTDAELMRRWQRGDLAAFEALVRRWQQPLGRFLSRLIDQPELAHDLCQEVFFRVYQAGPSYRESGAFARWLYRIALNVARDSRRRRRHEPEPLNQCEPAVGELSAAAQCEQQELGQAVRLALAELPSAHPEALALRHYEEMNFEAMARLLGTPASTL